MRVFFDSNVFLKYLAGVIDAKKLVDKVEQGEWKEYLMISWLARLFMDT